MMIALVAISIALGSASVLKKVMANKWRKRRMSSEELQEEEDYRMMSLAAKEADLAASQKDGGPFGAVVVRNGSVVAQAHNMVVRYADSTAHAEILAIQMACKVLGKLDLSDCEIFSSCEPSPMSFAAIFLARIPRLVYGMHAEAAHDLGYDSSHIADAIRGTSKFQKTSCVVKRMVHPEVASVFWKHRNHVELY